MDLAARAYQAAVEQYEMAAGRDPGNALLWNQLGYAQAYARDLESAVRSLSHYREMRPQEANPLDSLGDVHFYLGRFPEAEKHYLQAYTNEPSFLLGGELYKAAWARLMAGNLKGADETFGKFLQARQELKDALVPYRQAQWEYLTGRRKQAMVRLEQFTKASQPALASLGFAQLSIWSLETGDAARAREYAQRTAPGNNLAAICRFLTQPPASAAEWAARAERSFADPAQAGAKEYALGYALLFARSFREAAPRFRQLYQQTGPTSQEPVDVLLAWALLESGQINDAAGLLATNPLPEPTGERPFLSLSFPRVFFLRGLLAEKQGRGEDARANYNLFLRYSGEPPMSFGEEERARQSLSRPSTRS